MSTDEYVWAKRQFASRVYLSAEEKQAMLLYYHNHEGDVSELLQLVRGKDVKGREATLSM